MITDTSGSMKEGTNVPIDDIMTDDTRQEILDKASKDIEDALAKGLSMGGPSRNHSDQVITWTLRDMASRFGKRVANELVDKHELTSYGWSKVEVDDEEIEKSTRV